MPLDLESFNKLKKKVDIAQRNHDQAIGAMSTLLSRLNKEFGVSTKEEGLEKLERWKRKIETAEKELWKEIEEVEETFKQNWPAKEG